MKHASCIIHLASCKIKTSLSCIMHHIHSRCIVHNSSEITHQASLYIKYYTSSIMHLPLRCTMHQVSCILPHASCIQSYLYIFWHGVGTFPSCRVEHKGLMDSEIATKFGGDSNKNQGLCIMHHPSRYSMDHALLIIIHVS